MITRTRTVGDTRTPLGAHLRQRDANGDLQDIDVTSLTVKFKMVRDNGTVVVAETDTGVTKVTASEGKVQFDFSAGHVATAGVYYAWFVVYQSTESDHLPADGRTYKIILKDAA